MVRDNEIIKTFFRNRREGQLLLLSSYRSRVQSVISSVVQSREDIEELTQDTFLRIFDNIRHFDPDRGTLANWIYRIAYNKAQTFIAKQPPPSIPLDEAPPDSLDISDAQIDQELSSDNEERILALEEAISALLPDERFAINLYYYEDYAIADIAQILDISPNALYHRLQNIRKKLYNNIIRR
ncbi:MAG: sigma-70 family RNA polymerase sigma factor [Bacteroidaceae bacterium]|nr:sigma-70 family RNA polymerase sigma factor [Bacteroidaceae bacterium]